MTDALLFVALSLGTFRAWRLIGRDDITAFLRRPLPEIVLKGISCPWCFGTWCALLSTLAVDRFVVALHPHWLLWFAGVAASVGFLGEIDARLDDG